jgi:hypothetical protein
MHKNTQTETPVLLIGYRRPEYTKKQLKILKNTKIENIYISYDYFNKEISDDFQLMQHESSQIISSNCKPKFRIQNQNLGLVNHIFYAINWVLEEFENVIIFEDDILFNTQTIDFFLEQLSKIEDKTACCSGFSPQNFLQLISPIIKKNYTFKSIYFPAWGWCISKEIWLKFLKFYNNNYLNPSENYKVSNFQTLSNYSYKIWHGRYQKSREEISRTWDIPFQEFLMLNSFEVLRPIFTLTTNIGFLSDLSTNTKGNKPWWVPKAPILNRKYNSIKPLNNRFVRMIINFVDRISIAGDHPIFVSFIKFLKILTKDKKLNKN